MANFRFVANFRFLTLHVFLFLFCSLLSGYGDMAVSNSIGSNIFDILICLGLPWLIESAAIDNIDIQSNSIAFTAVTLFGTVVFLLISMLINGWKLDKKFSVVCLVVYFLVITVACLFETNVFMDVNPPPCS